MLWLALKAFPRDQPSRRYWVYLSDDWRVLRSTILRLEWLKEEKINGVELREVGVKREKALDEHVRPGIFKNFIVSVPKRVFRRQMSERQS